MNILFEPHVTAVLDVDVQAIKIGHVKLAKIWLKHVSFPYFQKMMIEIAAKKNKEKRWGFCIKKRVDRIHELKEKV